MIIKESLDKLTSTMRLGQFQGHANRPGLAERYITKGFVNLLVLITLSMGCQASDNILSVRINLQEATRQILKDTNKRVLGATTVTIDGREVHIIKVLTPDGHIQHYKIDAETGAVIG